MEVRVPFHQQLARPDNLDTLIKVYDQAHISFFHHHFGVLGPAALSGATGQL